MEEELRVCKQRHPESGETYYDVRMVYVKNGEVVGWHEEPYTPWGETARELYREFLRMYRSAQREVIDLDAVAARLERVNAAKAVENRGDQRKLERFDHQFEKPGT